MFRRRYELAAVAEMGVRFVADEIDIDGATRGGPYTPDVMETAMLRAAATA